MLLIVYLLVVLFDCIPMAILMTFCTFLENCDECLKHNEILMPLMLFYVLLTAHHSQGRDGFLMTYILDALLFCDCSVFLVVLKKQYYLQAFSNLI